MALWNTGDKSVRERIAPTIAFVGPLIILIAMAVYLRLTYESDPVVLTYDLPNRIERPADAQINAVPVEITLRLENRTDEGVDLVVSSECNILRWFLLDDSGSFIQSQVQGECTGGPVADRVGPNSTMIRTTSITLDGGRLQSGEKYHLMVRFWGHESRRDFRFE